MHDHAWRSEDEQPHGDQHHAGGLPRGSQDSGGVLDSLTEQLKMRGNRKPAEFNLKTLKADNFSPSGKTP